ncbi:ABC transporter ATP-binding protein [Vreelandella olivaria]|uniref:ABC transporter ATP-binding protein n=1 Tax=Vreelandella olivaria TaxID=390919 RepID=UPI00201F57A9|nr:ABC transporter ATP-binding protein [Halomonas olivaria]
MNDISILDAQGIAWAVKGHTIISDIDICLREGETLGLIGPNGSGKSTLLRIMAGLLKPTSGNICLKGQPMQRMARRQIARLVTLVSQQAETEDRITVRDAVELGRTPWLTALNPWGANDEAAVTQALQAVNMEAMSTREWSTLSGGERQRVHIARAHAQSPELLLLDEPTNHLDIHHQLAILDLVKTLPVTAVIALHDIHHALRCDRILVLKAGKKVALGPPANTLTSDLMRHVFSVDARMVPDPAGGASLISFQRIHST